MSNEVLDTIKNRRTAVRFEDTKVEEDKVEAILEAGIWAPSWINKQPWNFITVKDAEIKEKLSQIVPTTFVKGLKEAPMCIVVVVNPEEDPYHYVEDGAAATQNMALAAHSLGLASSWIGVFDVKNQKNSAESKTKQILDIPKTHRVISILPIGHAKEGPLKKERKPLKQVVYREKFGKR
jgi:nitroreductase